MTTLGEGIFKRCSSLTNIYVSTGNPVYYSIDGILYSKTKKSILVYPRGKKNKSFIIPDGIQCIASSAFYFNQHLVIPESATLFEYDSLVFDDKYSLREIHIGNKEPQNVTLGEADQEYINEFWEEFSGFEDFTQSFDKAGNVMLYVPYGSGHKYRRDKRFKGFKEIRIERTNTSLARNKLH